jgi:acyl-CoA thioesterase
MTTLGGGTHPFDRDTAVRRDADVPGRYTAVCSADWGVPAGLNGGYVASILARAVLEEVADPLRPLRSLTVQFVRPPVPGEPLDIEVTVERGGRTVSNVSVRATQAGKLVAFGIAIAAIDRASTLDYRTAGPELPDPDRVATLPRPPGGPKIAERYVFKPALGSQIFSGAEEALTGGWIRLDEPREFDAIAAVAYLDAWLPAPFTRLTEPVGAPTLDYTVHIRAPLPDPELHSTDFLMLRQSSTTSSQGYFEGDCEIWSPHGVLLAQARQLALLVPRGS